MLAEWPTTEKTAPWQWMKQQPTAVSEGVWDQMLQGMRHRQKEAEKALKGRETAGGGREKNAIDKGEPSKRRGLPSGTQRRRTGSGDPCRGG